MIKPQIKTGYEIVRELIDRLCREFNVDTNIQITETLMWLETTEPMMYWGIKRYRDHMYHSCRVALLGLKLLDMEFALPPDPLDSWPQYHKKAPKNRLERDRAIQLWRRVYEAMPDELVVSATGSEMIPHVERCFGCKQKQNVWDRNYSYCVMKPALKEDEIEAFVKRIWLIASLKHDIGYSLVYLQELAKRNKLLSDDQSSTISQMRNRLHDLYQTVHGIVRNHASALDSAMFTERDRVIGHGVIGALHVKGLLGEEYTLETAARAIAKHDDDSREVFFGREPVSWLLIVADELQEWGRPVYVGTHKSSDVDGVSNLNLSAKSELEHLSYTGPGSDPDDPAKFLFNYSSTEDILEYETGFSFPHFILNKQRNLSRLRGGPRIDFEFQSAGLMDRQFARLARAASVGHFTLDEWIRQVETGKYKMLMSLGHVNGAGDEYVPIERPLDVDDCLSHYVVLPNLA